MSQDTRKDPRAKIVSLNVRYKSATVDEFIDNHSHDVSKGGLFIKTTSPFPPGTLLKFEIRIAGDKAVIAGVGRVVWKRESAQAGPEQPAGMGVKFIKIDDASRQVIDKLIETRGEGKNAYDEGVGEGGPAGPAPQPASPAAAPAHAPAPAPAHTPVAVAAKVPARPTPIGLGSTPQPAPFRPAPSSSKIPMPGKATMMGIGGIHEAMAAKGGPASPAAGRPAADDLRTKSATPAQTPHATAPAPTATPASSAPSTTPMFPQTNSEADMPPKNEQTVMKQAAELLEEALRGAGGSMDEIGQNPLFDVAKGVKDGGGIALEALKSKPASDEGQSTVHGIGPVDLKDLAKPAAGETAATKARSETDEAKNAPAQQAAAAAASAAATGDVDSTLRSASADEEARVAAKPKPKVDSYAPKAPARAISSERPAAALDAFEQAPPKNKWLLPVVGLGAVAVLGFLFYSQVSETPDTDKVPPPPTSAAATPPSATPPAEPSASASAAPAASATASASAAPETSASASAAPAATHAVVAPAPQPRPQPPPPRPKPQPTATEAAPTSTETAPTPPPKPAPTPAETATAAPTAATPPPAPKPKPKPGKPKPEDDNPY